MMSIGDLTAMRHQTSDNLRLDIVGQASCLPFVTPDFDPGSSLDARVHEHDDRQSRRGETVPLKHGVTCLKRIGMTARVATLAVGTSSALDSIENYRIGNAHALTGSLE